MDNPYGQSLWTIPMDNPYIWTIPMDNPYIWTIPMGNPYGQSLWTIPMDNPYCSCKGLTCATDRPAKIPMYSLRSANDEA